MLQFADSLTLDAPMRTAEGYLITRARAARTGVYRYSGAEVDPKNEHGLRDKAIVNVLRDENTVFDKAASLSFVGKPVTDNHPNVSVNSDNWKDYARGTIMGALRDGEYLSFDLLITDASAIKKIDAGKRELSNGYAAQLEYGEFTASDGTICDARQDRILSGNHVALVDAGRAGSECGIKDGEKIHDPRNGGNAFALCDANPSAISGLSTGEIKMKITLDGLTVTLTDAAEVQAAFDSKAKIIADKDAEIATAQTEKAALATDKATLEAENATLKTQIADLAITPEKLRDAAKAFALVADKAKALGVAVTDSMDEAAIQRAVVDAKLGDIAANWTADQIAISFATLAKDAKATDDNVVPLINPAKIDDAASGVAAARKAWLADKANSHRASATAA